MLPLGGKLALAGRAASAQASATSQRATDASGSFAARRRWRSTIFTPPINLCVARETLRLLQDIEKTAESMYRVGEGRQADVLRAQVEIAKMAEDTLRMQAMRNRWRPSSTRSSIAHPMHSRLSGAARLSGFDSRSRVARGDRVRRAPNDPGGARRRSQPPKLGKAGPRKRFLPDLQIGIQYAQQGKRREMGGGTERMGSLMLGASIPVFARDRQLRMREEAVP